MGYAFLAFHIVTVPSLAPTYISFLKLDHYIVLIRFLPVRHAVN